MYWKNVSSYTVLLKSRYNSNLVKKRITSIIINIFFFSFGKRGNNRVCIEILTSHEHEVMKKTEGCSPYYIAACRCLVWRVQLKDIEYLPGFYVLPIKYHYVFFQGLDKSPSKPVDNVTLTAPNPTDIAGQRMDSYRFSMANLEGKIILAVTENN